MFGERRPAQVELDEHRVPPGQSDRVREVDRDRRLALARDRARHQQRVELVVDRGEVQRAAQDAVGLELVLALGGATEARTPTAARR